ncbi:MAG: hypothetical protein NZ927_09980, partial [Candidatus Calescibacterium sp.]|nr:hypothetical protein [Candidatus Calescibacterium sp.]
GYVEPSLEELPHLELTDFLDHGSLIIKPDFVRLEVKPRRMVIYLKPFEVIEFAKWIRELCLKKGFESRIVRENFEINLPKTYISVDTTFYVFEYHRKPEFYRPDRPGKVIMCNYDTPITKNFITWVFKEVEKEFLLFLEAYKEERRRQEDARKKRL